MDVQKSIPKHLQLLTGKTFAALSAVLVLVAFYVFSADYQRNLLQALNEHEIQFELLVKKNQTKIRDQKLAIITALDHIQSQEPKLNSHDLIEEMQRSLNHVLGSSQWQLQSTNFDVSPYDVYFFKSNPKRVQLFKEFLNPTANSNSDTRHHIELNEDSENHSLWILQNDWENLISYLKTDPNKERANQINALLENTHIHFDNSKQSNVFQDIRHAWILKNIWSSILSDDANTFEIPRLAKHFLPKFNGFPPRFLSLQSNQSKLSCYLKIFPSDFEPGKSNSISSNRIRLFPQQVTLIILDEDILNQMNILSTLKNHPILADYQLHVDYSHLKLSFKDGSQKLFIRPPVAESWHYNSESNTFIEIHKGDHKYQELFGDSFSKTREAIHFKFKDDHDIVYLASSFNAFQLGKTRITFYRKLSKVLSPLYFRWTLICCFLLISILSYLLIRRFYDRSIASSFNLCINAIAQDSAIPIDNMSEDELKALGKTLTDFNERIQIHIFRTELQLKFQSVLNQPYHHFNHYMQEFNYLTLEYLPHLHWKFLKIKPLDMTNIFVIEVNPEDQQYLKDFLNLPQEINLKMKDVMPNDSETDFLNQMFKQLVQTARLEDELIRKTSLEQELVLAADIQKSLLPSIEIIENDHYEISFSTNTVGKLRGDFLDFYVKDDHLIIYMADIASQGIGTTMIARSLKSFIRGLMDTYCESGLIMNRCNQWVCEETADDLLVSLTIVIYEIHSGATEISTAGANGSLILQEDSFNNILKPYPALGINHQIEYPSQNLNLKPNDIIYLYTHDFLQTNSLSISSQKRDLMTILEDSKSLETQSILQNLAKINQFTPVSGQGDWINFAMKVRQNL